MTSFVHCLICFCVLFLQCRIDNRFLLPFGSSNHMIY
nr:MAG TPA: hypothetical protein [Caudoviricetes sp.]